jgi:hypothetical protein
MATGDGARSQVSQSRTSDRRVSKTNQPAGRRHVRIAQGGVPVLVRDEDLRHVARHDGKVGGSLEADEGGGVAVDPRHEIGVWLGSGNVQRGSSRVNAGDGESQFGEPDSERTGPAADVDYAMSLDLVRDPYIGLEIAPVVVEDVVQDGLSRVRKGSVGFSHR